MSKRFEKIFNRLNDGAMIDNPAYNMRAVSQTFPQETAEWSRETAAKYRQYAMSRMETQVAESGKAWKAK